MIGTAGFACRRRRPAGHPSHPEPCGGASRRRGRHDGTDLGTEPWLWAGKHAPQGDDEHPDKSTPHRLACRPIRSSPADGHRPARSIEVDDPVPVANLASPATGRPQPGPGGLPDQGRHQSGCTGCPAARITTMRSAELVFQRGTRTHQWVRRGQLDQLDLADDVRPCQGTAASISRSDHKRIVRAAATPYPDSLEFLTVASPSIIRSDDVAVVRPHSAKRTTTQSPSQMAASTSSHRPPDQEHRSLSYEFARQWEDVLDGRLARTGPPAARRPSTGT